MLKLYAQAAVHKPSVVAGQVPVLPNSSLTKTLNIDAKHCNHYNQLTHWRPHLAALVHPNYAQTLSLSMQLEMMVASDFPFKPIGLVHLANQIHINFLPEQDARLTLKTSFGKLCWHKRGWVIEVITHAYIGTDLALTGKSYYLSRAKHALNAQQLAVLVQPLPQWIADGINAHNLNHTQETENKLDFSDDIGRKYARISGDYNPIHLHPYTAKLLGFKRAIAHGMFSKAWALSILAKQHSAFKSEYCINVLFSQPIVLPLNTKLVSQIDSSLHNSKHLLFNLHSEKRKKQRIHLLGSLQTLA
ncbi:MaoC family dehydratase [Glaciecola petra]|uniref:MaoC/PaaZ C-terminal domain-containing protein n=1 Tax=Glaciecola petra TaxID=3075602 RepID=A0ABU2ZT55_9ALTE|nr:MaoC/PaaZ C-terminal domain-containing protein [Aestuariibacter sp. P117]MDT0595817.1 MaoC/PaaZ C-terminal domain-containing protein [Aestuariibacter sp. P117]